MAIDQPHTGMGAILSVGDGQSPENFTPVLGVKSISGPSISRDTHDTTQMNQTRVNAALETVPDLYRKFVGGLVDAGEVSFDADWLPRHPSQNQDEGGLMAEFDRGSCDSIRNWRIEIPDCPGEPEAYMQFAGILTGMGIEIPMDDLMAFSGTIKVSGRPELVVEES